MARDPKPHPPLQRFCDEWDVLPRSTNASTRYYDLGPQNSCAILGYFKLEAQLSAKLYATAARYRDEGCLSLASSYQASAQEQRAVVSMLKVRWERAVREEARRGYRFVRAPDNYHWLVQRFKPRG